MKEKQRIVVVIPTRDRADTLRFSIESVVRSDYPNLRLIVSNNCSYDDTAELVEGIDDPRVDLITTPDRISMSENFEFAIQHVIETEPEDAFVLMFGDDDGLIPQGIERFLEVVADFPDHNAFTWKMQTYRWPSVSDSLEPNHLSLKLGEAHPVVVRSEERFEQFAAGDITYEGVVRIYHGLVKVSSLKRLRTQGRLIHSPIPDVYLGAALTCSLDEFVEIPFPVSIAGMSGHSNGVFQIRGGKPRSEKTTAGDFFKDSNLAVHPSVKVMPRSVRVCEFETLQHLRDLGFWKGQVDPVREFGLMLKEASEIPASQKETIGEITRQIAAYFGWNEQLAEAKAIADEHPSELFEERRYEKPVVLNRKRGFCKVNGDYFALQTIMDASILSGFALEVFQGGQQDIMAAVSVGQVGSGQGVPKKQIRAKKSWFLRLKRTFRRNKRQCRPGEGTASKSGK
jgi:hypothetical protein